MNVLDYLKRDEIVELGCDLIRQPSLTRQEGPAVSFVRDWFEENGFEEIELQEVEPGRKQVIARLKGDGSGRSMMFNGHLSNTLNIVYCPSSGVRAEGFYQFFNPLFV